MPVLVPATILVADDSDASRMVLTTMLSIEHYRVLEAADGHAALHALESCQAIDLALLDVVMPGMDGLSICRFIKSDPEMRLIPVVLVTGLSATEDRIRGIEAGADDFLSKPFIKEELLARVRSLLRLKQYTDELEKSETVLFALARSIEAKDPHTEFHCERLSAMSEALARRLGLPPETCIALRRGGIVHDIGKVAVPDSILNKPGPLTDAERLVMEQHPVVGETICAPLKSMRAVLPIIRHHHEKLDGSGYPDGLRGDQIPLEARILQTVDVYDALTTDRPYRNALSRQEAFRIMNEEVRKGWWDVRLVEEFASLVETEEMLRGTLSLDEAHK